MRVDHTLQTGCYLTNFYKSEIGSLTNHMSYKYLLNTFNQRHRFWIHQLSGVFGLRVESSGITVEKLTGSNQLADKKVLQGEIDSEMWLPQSKWGHLNAVKARLQDPQKIDEPILAEHLKIKKILLYFLTKELTN